MWCKQENDRPYILQVLDLDAVNEDHSRGPDVIILNQRSLVASSVEINGM